jgi:hypothetical protein
VRTARLTSTDGTVGTHSTRQRLQERCGEGSVRGGAPGPGWAVLPLQDRELMAQAKISASLSRSLIGSSRTKAKALVTAR